MSEMHEWESVVVGRRTRVPGGWIYLLECWGDTDTNSRPVFVPAPPRLVSLPTAEGLHTLVGPGVLIQPYGEPSKDAEFIGKLLGAESTPRTGWCRVSWGGVTVDIKGTPAEVAARLGLEVQE